MGQSLTRLFNSYILGGFESACHINIHHKRLDMIAATQHDVQARSDYRNLKDMGILTARDGVRWGLIEPAPGQYDFSSLEPMVEAAKAEGVQVIWTLCHYGWPDDLDIFSPEFVTRFADFSAATARFIKCKCGDDVPFYAPINEMSFLAFMSGENAEFFPFAHNRGAELKAQLVKAAIAAMDAIWAVDPRARMCHIDPLMNTITPKDGSVSPERVAEINEWQFQTFDMLAGLRDPELGGDAKYLDIIGLNFYPCNECEPGGEPWLFWTDDMEDDRWVGPSTLIEQVYERYKRPMFLSETSHVYEQRPAWMRYITNEIAKVVAKGIPFEGICLYPIIDREDWDDYVMDHAALWDQQLGADGTLTRVLNEDYADEVRRAQVIFGDIPGKKRAIVKALESLEHA